MHSQLMRSTAAAYYAAGDTVAEIAKKMNLSDPTVRKYLSESMATVAQMSEKERLQAEVTQRPAPPTSDRGIAIEKRIGGWTYKAIGDLLGYDEKMIRVWVREEMERLHALEVDCMDAQRRLQIERVERMLEGLWSKASNGDPKAVDTVLKLLERQAKLLGLDAPEKVELEHHMRQVVEELGLTEEDGELAVKELELMLKRGSKRVGY